MVPLFPPAPTALPGEVDTKYKHSGSMHFFDKFSKVALGVLDIFLSLFFCIFPYFLPFCLIAI